MTARMKDILAWAKRGQELLGVSVERILEAAAEWEEREPDDPAEPTGRGKITYMTARALKPGISCELVADRMMIPERRRLVLNEAKSMMTESPSAIAERLFDLAIVDPRYRSNFIRTIREDIEYHKRMGSLDGFPASASKANGPVQDDLLT